ncbi:hypothetical protein [Rubrolithibacter danxiaensis]|uniref:hypothetical protein n=1 Tax=Rubrolithibacter danxiaensis TaxID=3390805 RepID=UPI003BF8407A
MNRRNFLYISFAGAAGITLPFVRCKTKTSDVEGVLVKPQLLSQLCDEKTVITIGKDYLRRFPEEAKSATLESLLLTDEKGNAVSETASLSAIQTLLDKKIQQDFRLKKILTLKGWILSVTEGRQCALYSLIHS